MWFEEEVEGIFYFYTSCYNMTMNEHSEESDKRHLQEPANELDSDSPANTPAAENKTFFQQIAGLRTPMPATNKAQKELYGAVDRRAPLVGPPATPMSSEVRKISTIRRLLNKFTPRKLH